MTHQEIINAMEQLQSILNETRALHNSMIHDLRKTKIENLQSECEKIGHLRQEYYGECIVCGKCLITN